MITNNQFRNRQQHGKVTHMGLSGKASREKLNKFSRTMPLVFTGNTYTHTIPYIFARAHTEVLATEGREIGLENSNHEDKMDGWIGPARGISHTNDGNAIN